MNKYGNKIFFLLKRHPAERSSLDIVRMWYFFVEIKLFSKINMEWVATTSLVFNYSHSSRARYCCEVMIYGV